MDFWDPLENFSQLLMHITSPNYTEHYDIIIHHWCLSCWRTCPRSAQVFHNTKLLISWGNVTKGVRCRCGAVVSCVYLNLSTWRQQRSLSVKLASSTVLTKQFCIIVTKMFLWEDLLKILPFSFCIVALYKLFLPAEKAELFLDRFLLSPRICCRYTILSVTFWQSGLFNLSFNTMTTTIPVQGGSHILNNGLYFKASYFSNMYYPIITQTPDCLIYKMSKKKQAINRTWQLTNLKRLKSIFSYQMTAWKQCDCNKEWSHKSTAPQLL